MSTEKGRNKQTRKRRKLYLFVAMLGNRHRQDRHTKK
jgi:hypothetical protein